MSHVACRKQPPPATCDLRPVTRDCKVLKNHVLRAKVPMCERACAALPKRPSLQDADGPGHGLITPLAPARATRSARPADYAAAATHQGSLHDAAAARRR